MTPKKLSGKTALITGASKGLGRAMAIALGSAGATLALVARDKTNLEDTAAAVRATGADAHIFTADVTVESQVLQLERDVTAATGNIQILINNAGVNVRKPITGFTREDWNLVMDTNLTSVFLMCRSFVPHMQGNGYGRILNMTSIMSHVSLPGRGAYSASKAGLLGLTRALALELAPDAITVVGISPGPFATEMNTLVMENPELNQQFVSKIALGRWGKVEEIGELAVYLCSPEAGFITGTDIVIDGGWCAQ
ncbi:MAG TPA: SDR family NAD(P)-dependent oxidoreductase [Bryobacteraceae bacterium]|nr:SDR family NAD(P)-dependent oxidoreductase [Bryobacteraceae bacterium]